MTPRTFALLMGVIFGLVGIGGFVPGLWHPAPADAPPLVADGGYGLVLGIFPVNTLHNLVHLAFAALGVAAWAAYLSALTYARLLAIVYGLLAVMGLVPGLNTTFGLVPIYGADVVLHAGIAAAAAYVGYKERSVAPPRPAA